MKLKGDATMKDTHYADSYIQSDIHSKKRCRKQHRAWLLVVLLCCCLASAAIGAGSALLITSKQNHIEEADGVLQQNINTSIVNTAYSGTNAVLTASEIYARYVNSTVGITTSVTTNLFGRQTTSAASGSGFILTSDGYILTNYHVIEGSSQIAVALYSGASYSAKIIGYDETNDIAVLKIDASDLTPVVVGSSSDLEVGEDVVAIGNPLGELTFSLTAGVVSALNREITVSSGVTMNLIQTDCAINSGNSGGALFNMHGEVVGITNAKYSSSSGASIDNIAFAIPIDDVYGIVESIIQNRGLIKPFIGVSVTDVSAQMQRYGLPGGAAVQSVSAGSPAEKAGLQTGDIITKVNGADISTANALLKAINGAKAGDIMKLTVYRQGNTREINVTISEKLQTS